MNLANCLSALGDIARALPLARRAYDGFESLLGLEDPYTLTSMNNLPGHLSVCPETYRAIGMGNPAPRVAPVRLSVQDSQPRRSEPTKLGRRAKGLAGQP